MEEEYLYTQKLKNGKTLVRVDTLRCLDDCIDESCFLVRDYLFDALAGIGDINRIFATMYRKYPKFRTYVNDRFYYGDSEIPIITRIITPLRERIDEYTEEIIPILKIDRGKFLIRSRDYLYFAYNTIPDINLKGVHVLC